MIVTKELKPMHMGTAVEVIKLLKPYVSDIRLEREPEKLLVALIKGIQEVNPTDSIRLVSLMFGMKPQEVMDRFGEAGKAGPMLLAALTQGFAVNPLPDLVNTGFVFGLLDEGWTDAGRTD